MPLFAPPNWHYFEAADSTIRSTGRRFNSTRGRDGRSVSECMTSGTPGLKVSMLTSATPTVFGVSSMPSTATGQCNRPTARI